MMIRLLTLTITVYEIVAAQIEQQKVRQLSHDMYQSYISRHEVVKVHVFINRSNYACCIA